jgi:hypothetical protein
MAGRFFSKVPPEKIQNNMAHLKLNLLALVTLLASALTFYSCQKDQAAAPAEAQQVIDETHYYTPNLGDFVTDRSGYWTEIPAGSVDALNAAIAEADEGGVIYLKAGMHTETDRVTINKQIKLIGEDGAVLKIASSDTVSTLNPAIYVLNAPGTAIQNLEILSLDDFFATTVIYENSPGSALLSCKISDFGIAVWVERSDRIAIIDNEISGAGYWGIIVGNGQSAYIGNNDIHNCGLGIWACDRWGTLINNHFHENGNGAMLCKFNVAFEQTIPSSGDPIGSDYSGTGWKVRNNQFTDNEGIGLFITDGSNQNLIFSDNEYLGNELYDIEITQDRYDPDPPYLFIPGAFKNTIHAAPNVKIKDCGYDNVINGGTLVDTTVDPC